MAVISIKQNEPTSKRIDRWMQQKQFTVVKQVEFLQDMINILPFIGNYIVILETIAKHATADKKLLANDMITQLRAGRSLADGMEGWFNDTLITAVKVCEEQGVLATSLQPTLDVMNEGTSKVYSALQFFILPFIYTLILIFIWSQLRVSFFDVLVTITGGDLYKLPPTTKTLYDTVAWAWKFGFIIPIVIVATIIILRMVMVNYTGPFRQTLDKLPIFKQYAHLNGADFLRTYAILKRINVSEFEVIQISKRRASPYLNYHLNLYNKRIREGVSNIGNVLEGALYPPELSDRLVLLSGSDHYIEAMKFASDEISKRTLNNINKIARILSFAWLIGVVSLVIITINGLVNSSQVANALS